MRSRRRQLTNAVVAAAILVAGGALAFSGWRALFPGDPSIDCGDYAFPTRTWRAALRARPTDEALTRRLARNVVRCDLAVGRSVPEVRALLGRPDAKEFFERGGRRLGWFSYVVGVNNSDDVDLYLEFDGGRASFVSAPDRDPNGFGDDLRTGTPQVVAATRP